MKYMLLVCNDGIEASEAEETLVGEAIEVRPFTATMCGEPFEAEPSADVLLATPA
jgi:hypothetical protein